MTLVLQLVNAVDAKLRELSLKEISASPVRALAARVSTVIMLSEEEYVRQLRVFPDAIQPHVQQLRRAALPLLQELESSNTKLMAKTMAENVKMEELIRSVCKDSENLRKTVSRIDLSQRADILTHAQRLVPHCLTETAVENILDVIARILPEQRKEALEQLPELLSKCDLPDRQNKLTHCLKYLMSPGTLDGTILKEYLALLNAIAPQYWENLTFDADNPMKWLSVCKKALPFFTDYVLSNIFALRELLTVFSSEKCSDSVLKHVLLLKEYSAGTADLEKIISRIDSTPEEQRGTVVQNCISLLTPLDEKIGNVRRMFEILQSSAGSECVELAALMQHGTPWLFLFRIKGMLVDAPAHRRIEVKEALANLLGSNRCSDDLDKALISLSQNITAKRELSNIADTEATFLLNSLSKGIEASESNKLRDAALNIPFANRLAILRNVQYLIPTPGMYKEKLSLLTTLGDLDKKGVNTSKLVFDNAATIEAAGSDKYPGILTKLASSIKE